MCLLYLPAATAEVRFLDVTATMLLLLTLVSQGLLEEAVSVYNKSLMEHRTADTLKRLNETEKKLKVWWGKTVDQAPDGGPPCRVHACGEGGR